MFPALWVGFEHLRSSLNLFSATCSSPHEPTQARFIPALKHTWARRYPRVLLSSPPLQQGNWTRILRFSKPRLLVATPAHASACRHSLARLIVDSNLRYLPLPPGLSPLHWRHTACLTSRINYYSVSLLVNVAAGASDVSASRSS